MGWISSKRPCCTVSSVILVSGLIVPIPPPSLSLFPSDTALTAHGVASQSRHCARRAPCFSPRCEPSPSGTHYIRGTPGEETWCDADKICFPDFCTADALVSHRGDTMFKSFTFRTSGRALPHGSSPKRNLKITYWLSIPIQPITVN